MEQATDTLLKKTPLNARHRASGAKMVPFGGWDMPVEYSGIVDEHIAVRTRAGLFDVSHMGEIEIAGKDALAAVQRISSNDASKLKVGQAQYSGLLTPQGTFVDDLLVYRLAPAHFLLVVNAGNIQKDYAWIAEQIKPAGDAVAVDASSRYGLIALQGPKASSVLAKFCADAASMRFMDAGPGSIDGIDCFVSRSGYTGEDGFEISVPAEHAERLAKALLGNGDVLPIGLGARDSLRLEAGLCLYGHDIDATTTPVEGALEWSIQKSRRHGGARAGGFPGADQILSQLENGAARRRVGLRPEGRAPVREGAPLFADAASSEQIGAVTSGGFGPSINAPVAMGYLPSSHAIGGLVFAELRGQRLPLRVAATPFVPNTYKR